MPLLLRLVTRNLWLKEPIRPWLEKGEIPADTLTNLRTKDNGLSVFVVMADRSNLEQIITAQVASRTKVDKYECLLFDQQILSTASIDTEQTPGKTIDSVVNSWHLDLVGISGSQLLTLVTQILRSNYETDRRHEWQIRDLLKQAVHDGRVRRDDMPSKLQKDVFPA